MHATLNAPTATPPATPPVVPPIALGHLVLLPSLRNPRLLLSIVCPRCLREHVHSWHTDVPSDQPQRRVPHCRDATPSTPEYSVRPASTPANCALLREYARRCEAAESAANAAK